MIWLIAATASAQDGCNGIDDDSDGQFDEDAVFLSLGRDADGDGFGAVDPIVGCAAEDVYVGQYYVVDPYGVTVLSQDVLVEDNQDCNDFNANIHPDAVEVCDGLDNDCNEGPDDIFEFVDWFVDGDGDGFGAGDATSACKAPGPEWVTTDGDCADRHPEQNPAAIERCDDLDNDCDGLVDINADDAPLLFEDLDGDGLGDPDSGVQTCDPGETYTSAVGTDCDDSDPDVLEACASGCGCQASPSQRPWALLRLVIRSSGR